MMWTSWWSVEHVLTIVHPGDLAATPTLHTLVQTLDSDGEPVSYAMWVDSVICRDTVCDVVKVRIHWDALGRYQRYEIAPGSQLTKLDHVPFTKADLAKLQRILAASDSPLKEVEKESMTGKETNLPKGVDAVSSPTILTLKTAVIVGAGYTCYDLWHWANGLLTDHIRNLTGTGSSVPKLRTYLARADPGTTHLAKYCSVDHRTRHRCAPRYRCVEFPRPWQHDPRPRVLRRKPTW